MVFISESVRIFSLFIIFVASVKLLLWGSAMEDDPTFVQLSCKVNSKARGKDIYIVDVLDDKGVTLQIFKADGYGDLKTYQKDKVEFPCWVKKEQKIMELDFTHPQIPSHPNLMPFGFPIFFAVVVSGMFCVFELERLLSRTLQRRRAKKEKDEALLSPLPPYTPTSEVSLPPYAP